MHGYISKCVKMHRKPTGGTNKHGKHIIVWSRKKRERHTRTNPAPGDTSQMVTPKQGHWASDVTINPLRVSNVATPRTGEASTSIKHRSKPTLTYK